AEAVDLLCRAYPVVPAATLRDRTPKRLAQVTRLLSGRITLDQHRELLVITGWLTALLGCAHYDLGEREDAETARQAAYEMGRQVGHGEHGLGTRDVRVVRPCRRPIRGRRHRRPPRPGPR